MIVMKFGGTSVATADRIRTATDLIITRLPKRPLAVVSALSGVTDALLDAAQQAYQGKVDVLPLIRRHRQVCEDLGVDKDLVTPLLLDLKDLLKGISLVRELTPRSLDFAASFGERCSSEIVAATLRKKGYNAQAYPAWELGLITNDDFTHARPLPESEQWMHEKIMSLPQDQIPIVTGYIAKNRAGEITTLGRNGSDFSGALFGAASRAEAVEIWTDVDGVMTADPSLIPEAKPLAVMTYDEASELAYYGGKVLHPATIAPAMKRDIPVLVLNTLHPEAPGTRIVRERSGKENENLSSVVQSVVYKEDQYLITVKAANMLYASGFLARIFNILAKHNVVIDLVATSEITVSMTTDSDKGLNEAIRELGEFCEVTLESEKAIVGVVGQGISKATGVITSEVFHVVRELNVGIDLVSVGASKINVTFLISNKDIAKVVRALHNHFYGTKIAVHAPQPVFSSKK